MQYQVLEISARGRSERTHLVLIQVEIQQGVRSDVPLGEGLSGTDLFGMGGAEDFDQPVPVIQILAQGIDLRIPRIVRIPPQLGILTRGQVERRDRVLRRHHRAVLNLLVVRVPFPVDPVEERIDIEAHGICAQPDGVVALIRRGQRLLYGEERRGNLRQFELVDLPVDPLQVLQLVGRGRIGIRRHQGIADQPVEVGALPGPFGPLGNAPGPGRIGVGVALPLSIRILGIGLPVGRLDDLVTGPRPGGRDAGKGFLVEIIRLDHVIQQRIIFRASEPVEGIVAQQLIMHFTGGQEMAPGITVALRIQGRAVEFVDESVFGDVVNVVVGVVGRFTEPLYVVPEQPVVGRVGFQEIGTAQQGQLFVQQVRFLVLEGMDVGRNRQQPFLVGHGNRGILRVGVGLAGQDLVQSGQPSGGQQQGLVGAVGGGPWNIQGQFPGPGQHRFVQRDQADILDHILVGIQCDRSIKRRTRYLKHTAVGRGGFVVIEIGVPGFVGIDSIQDPFHPAHHELGNESLGPVGLELRRVERARPLERDGITDHPGVGVGGAVDVDQPPAFGRRRRQLEIGGDDIIAVGLGQLLLFPIPHVEELICEHEVRSAGEFDLLQTQPFLVDLPLHFFRRSLDRIQALDLPHPPLVIHVFGVPAEVAGVAQIDLLVEHILGLHHLDGAAIPLVAEPDNMQRDSPARRGMVVLHDGHVERPGIGLGEQRRMRDQCGPGAQAVEGREDIVECRRIGTDDTARRIGGIAVRFHVEGHE